MNEDTEQSVQPEQPAQPEASSKDIDAWDVVKKTYSVVLRNIPLCLGIIIVFALIDMVVIRAIALFGQALGDTTASSMDAQEVLRTMTAAGAIIYAVWILVLVPLKVCLYFGTQKVFLEKMTQDKTSIMLLFSPFKHFLRVIGATVTLWGLMIVILFLFSFALFMVSAFENTTLTIIASIVLAVVGFYIIIKFIAFHFYGLVILEQGKGAIDSLKTAYRGASPYVIDIVIASFLLLVTLIPIIAFLGVLEVDTVREYSSIMYEGLLEVKAMSASSGVYTIMGTLMYVIHELLLLLITVMYTIFYKKIFVRN